MKQLTLADEIVVLMLRDDTGEIRAECAKVAHIAIAGVQQPALSFLRGVLRSVAPPRMKYAVDSAPIHFRHPAGEINHQPMSAQDI